MTCGWNYLLSAGKTRGGVCMPAHQTEFVEVRKEPPGVDVRQAVSHLQVGQRGGKHLGRRQQRRQEVREEEEGKGEMLTVVRASGFSRCCQSETHTPINRWPLPCRVNLLVAQGEYLHYEAPCRQSPL